MNLSKRASNYLSRLTRDAKWTSSANETKTYLINQNIYPNEEFLRCQKLYSGYELTIQDKPEQSFLVALFSNRQVLNNEPLELEHVADRLLEVCGSHKTAPFTFFITDQGEICTLDNDDLPNILHSSIDKLIEAYALRNEIHSWASTPYYFEIKQLDSLNIFMNSNFQVIKDCSDAYSTWWKKNNLIAIKGIWLDRPEPYLHVYGKSSDQCNGLIHELKDRGVLT